MKKTGFTVRGILICACCFLSACAGDPGTAAWRKAPSIPVINEIVSSSRGEHYDKYGSSSDWIELRNPSDKPVSIKNYGLSDDPENPFKYRFPDVPIAGRGYLVVRASGMEESAPGELHAPFKLDRGGETIILTTPSGRSADRIDVPVLPENRSYGRPWSDPAGWAVLAESSPGRPNTNPFTGETRTPPVRSNVPSGSYPGGLSLVLSTADPGAEIRYTLDGSAPDLSSPVFGGPLSVSENLLPEKTLTSDRNITEGYYPPAFSDNRAVVVRARAFADGALPSEIFSGVYFPCDLGKTYTMPVLSVTADPRDLMDPADGIYVLGEVYGQWRKENPGAKFQGDSPANFNRRGEAWRIPVAAEFFDGSKGFSRNAEMKIVGGWSRATPQKSFQLFFHAQDDAAGGLEYELFPGLLSRDGGGRAVDFFRSVIFRNGGNDWPFTLFRDPMIAGLLRDFPLDTQASRPCVVYLNGEYWGILNMREAYDEGYFHSHYRIPMDRVAVLEGKTLAGDGETKIGTKKDAASYGKTVGRIEAADFATREAFEEFGKEIDFRNHALYTAVELWIANGDWPGNNIRYWKYTGAPPTSSAGNDGRVDVFDGRYRWLLYDTEFSFNIYEPYNYTRNMFDIVTAQYGPDWPNPEWSTVLTRQFMKNPRYRRLLVNACCDLSNTVLNEAAVGKAVDEMEALYGPEMAVHQARWPGAAGGTLQRWKYNFGAIRTFARNRNEIFHRQMRMFFNLGDPAPVSVDVSKGGSVRLNNLTLPPGTFTGSYYPGTAVDLTAVPDPGWVFTGWSGSSDSSGPSLSLDPGTGLSVTAVFRKQ